MTVYMYAYNVLLTNTCNMYEIKILLLLLLLLLLIHHFQLKFVSIYRKEVKIIALTYFLATLPILATKIAITHYLVIVSIWD